MLRPCIVKVSPVLGYFHLLDITRPPITSRGLAYYVKRCNYSFIT